MTLVTLNAERKETEPYLLIQECYRVLHNAKSNIVWEILRQSEAFVQWNHYPKGDVYDPKSHAQYFYHAHPAANDGAAREEHGHFHLFIRKQAIPANCKPVEMEKEGVPEGSQQYDLCHLIAIAMDKQGYPIKLFTTNRWVTGETWYSAEDVSQMLDLFVIDHTYPSWPTNIWLSSMVKLFKPEIMQLIKERDQKILEWKAQHSPVNVYEDRNLEIISSLEIELK